MQRIPYLGVEPQIAGGVFLAPGSFVIGDVEMGANSSLWFNAVIRGDVNYVRVGARTNIQDNSVVHVTDGGHPTIIANDVTIGHSAVIHACKIHEFALIGMGAVVLDGAEIGARCLVAAGAVVTQNKSFPEESMIVGAPAKVVRKLKQAELDYLDYSARHYVEVAKNYR